MRTVEQRLVRLQKLLPLLACPACGGSLAHVESELVCQDCSLVYSVVGGVPVLIPPELVAQGLGVQLGADENISKHPYSPASAAILEQFADGWVLDLGAGGKHIENEQVVQVDVFRFPMTDVVASADCLPFRTNTFDAVISQAVFEHLQYPDMAAEEVLRVLKLGGIAKIDTAFLQPEHAYPHHYFNATEAGLRHWFRNFEIEWSGVEPYQHPMWSLVWILSDYLTALPADNRRLVGDTTLQRAVDVLSAVSRGCATEEDMQTFQALQNFEFADAMRRLAAGVSVRAVKRVQCGSRQKNADTEGLPAERRAQFLQGKLDEQVEWMVTVQFAQKLAADRSRWLALQLEKQSELEAHLRLEVGLRDQGISELRAHLYAEIAWRDRAISELQSSQKAAPLSMQLYWWCVSALKKVLPACLFEQLRQLRATSQPQVTHQHASSSATAAEPVVKIPFAQQPDTVACQQLGCGLESDGVSVPPRGFTFSDNWVHIEVTPQSVHDLLDQFFSLVHQSHTDWCLYLVTDESQSAPVQNAMRLLQTSDSRVSVSPPLATLCSETPNAYRQGWSISLPPDVKLHPDALLEVVSLARGNEKYRYVAGNTLRLDLGDVMLRPFECVAGQAEAVWPAELDLSDLMAWPVFEKQDDLRTASVCSRDVARIPKLLFYRWSAQTT